MNFLPTVIVFLFIVISFTTKACPFDGNETLGGSLTPTGSYQTQTNVNNGNYFSVNVSCGDTYNFNLCDNGGSSPWDTQITVLQTDGTTEVVYNDDFCDLQSSVTWTSSFTGTVFVLVSQYDCDNTGGSTGATLAYNVNPSKIEYLAFDCSSADVTLTGNSGGTYSFNPNPGDGAIINSSTGSISNGTLGATYTIDYNDLSCGLIKSTSVTLLNGNASFIYSPFCGGATTTILGDTGGTFSFNPNPGDGAQISSTSGIISNGTAGTTYHADYTVCGATTNESVTVLTDNCWTLNGNAQFIDINGEQCIELTEAINSQTGCSWNTSTIDFHSDFSLTLDYYFGNNLNGADGNTFTFQPSSSSSCGSDGEQLGAGNISNALVIEFDTYDNGYSGEMACDHIAIEIDGDMTNGTPLEGPVCAKSNGDPINDGGTYTVDIEWNSTTQTLDVYFDGALRLTTTNDFVTNVFGGQNNLYWGATSATGGFNNQQYFCPSTVVVLPIELGDFESKCDDNVERFEWTTITENSVDYFVLEYTYDNFVFQPVGTVDAIGNSQTTQYYSHSIEREDDRQRYYRLKIIDKNGAIDYTDIIAGQNCGKNELIQNVIQSESELIISTSKNANVRVINQVGKDIFNQATINNTCVLSKSQLSVGVYFIQVIDENGIQETRKIMIFN